MVFALTEPSNQAEQEVAKASWGKGAANKTPEAFVKTANASARLSVAQAEYYFDWSGIKGGEEKSFFQGVFYVVYSFVLDTMGLISSSFGLWQGAPGGQPGRGPRKGGPKPPFRKRPEGLPSDD